MKNPACTAWIADFLANDPPRSKSDRKSTRLNSSHTVISYAVFCLKKKKKIALQKFKLIRGNVRVRQPPETLIDPVIRHPLLSDVLHFLRAFFFFNDTATTEIYTLSLHDALPISLVQGAGAHIPVNDTVVVGQQHR